MQRWRLQRQQVCWKMQRRELKERSSSTACLICLVQGSYTSQPLEEKITRNPVYIVGQQSKNVTSTFQLFFEIIYNSQKISCFDCFQHNLGTIYLRILREISQLRASLRSWCEVSSPDRSVGTHDSNVSLQYCSICSLNEAIMDYILVMEMPPFLIALGCYQVCIRQTFMCLCLYICLHFGLPSPLCLISHCFCFQVIYLSGFLFNSIRKGAMWWKRNEGARLENTNVAMNSNELLQRRIQLQYNLNR